MLSLQIFDATASLDGALLPLPPRELALLTALAISPRIWPSYRLIPLLWPAASTPDSSSLKVYVHRLRCRIGAQVILSTNRGYELNRTTQVDLWRAEALMQRDRLRPSERDELVALYRRSQADRNFLGRAAWFARTEELIQAAGLSISARLSAEPAPKTGFLQQGFQAAVAQ